MALRCNIDARGQAARLRAGLATLALAVLAAILALLGVAGEEATWPWWVAGGLAAAGAFAVFEARAGWCAVRAMGIRTRI